MTITDAHAPLTAFDPDSAPHVTVLYLECSHMAWWPAPFNTFPDNLEGTWPCFCGRSSAILAYEENFPTPTGKHMAAPKPESRVGRLWLALPDWLAFTLYLVVAVCSVLTVAVGISELVRAF